MKAEVKEEEVVKHWGIWLVKNKCWFASDEGIIYSVTCPRVANAQHEFMITRFHPYHDKPEELEVREIA